MFESDQDYRWHLDKWLVWLLSFDGAVLKEVPFLSVGNKPYCCKVKALQPLVSQITILVLIFQVQKYKKWDRRCVNSPPEQYMVPGWIHSRKCFRKGHLVLWTSGFLSSRRFISHPNWERLLDDRHSLKKNLLCSCSCRKTTMWCCAVF